MTLDPKTYFLNSKTSSLDFSFGKTTQKIGGKGRHEVLILFSNDGDTALKDVILSDIIPEKFEIKDWLIRGNSDKRDDCEMASESGEGGTHITWTIPIVEKGERLEVSFEINQYRTNIHGPESSNQDGDPQ